jgi:hypothetical protein
LRTESRLTTNQLQDNDAEYLFTKFEKIFFYHAEPIAEILLRHSGESRNPAFSVRSGPRLSPG